MEIEDSRYENSQRWGTYREKTKNELPKKLLVKLLVKKCKHVIIRINKYILFICLLL